MKRRTLIKATLGSATTLLSKSLLSNNYGLIIGNKSGRNPESQHAIPEEDPVTHYQAIGGKISGRNLRRYNNRPLYINNTNAFILTGDQPIARLARGKNLYGSFYAGIQRQNRIKWLHQFSEITSGYQSGQMSWTISDAEWTDLQLSLSVLPLVGRTGMAIQFSAEGIQPEDQLFWTFGGASHQNEKNLSWHLDIMGNSDLIHQEMLPFDYKYNHPYLKGKNYFLDVYSESDNRTIFRVKGNCSIPGKVEILPNLAEISPVSNMLSEQKIPCIQGSVRLKNRQNIFWSFEAIDPDESFLTDKENNPEREFYQGLIRTQSFREQLRLVTPDPYFDAVANSSVAAVDGTWYPPVFVHGAMQWNNRFPGWRTIFGGTMLGWHERVKAEAQFYCDAQIKESDKKTAKADPALLLTSQHKDSRFYGVGYINKDQQFYNMQTQFFDQLIEAYRWTNDPGLIAFLRSALELHLLWLRECFDPDGKGVYESYINVWPTDSVWYNGGSSAETTAYAYRGHVAAKDMARQAGDLLAEQQHEQQLQKIKEAFFKQLWIKGKGHCGSYREHGGHERLHENPWLYSIFLPIDARLLSPIQSIESVYYTEWALQNDRMPSGGRKVWTSNYVPGIWSVREVWPGDNYHLALSYFQSGLPNEAWDIMKGNFMHSAYNGLVPGNLGDIRGGTDFGDCLHPFVRTVAAGLFGYRPDYPNKKVTIAPQFPTNWTHTEITVPDIQVKFKRQNNEYQFSFQIARPADVDLRIPVQCKAIESVLVNNHSVDWTLEETVGRSLLCLQIPNTKKAEITIKIESLLPFYDIIHIAGNVDEDIQFDIPDATITQIIDPQAVLAAFDRKTGKGTLSHYTGNHTLIFSVVIGKAPQWRVFRVKINDPQGEARKLARHVNDIPSNAIWNTIDIHSAFNADVTQIYKQQYLSPRPQTVSTQLGTDGYSPWTFPYWNSVPPEIKLNNVKSLMDVHKQKLITPQGVPFLWDNNKDNIAFTSLWDNYPSKINFPINQKGHAIFFLVCGSTNVMQCGIENGIIRLHYANGTEDSLALIPPENYWSLSPISANATAPGQDSRNDYTAATDRFCLPEKLPETVQLGENCRAMLLNLKLHQDSILAHITFETLSQEVVIGLMGITIMH